MAKYGPTPPGILPVDGVDTLVPICTPVIQSVFPSVLEVETFSDASPHDLAAFPLPENRGSTIVAFCSAFDGAGNQFAFSLDAIAFVRFGSGFPSLFGGINLNFAPNVPPWNTITATATIVGPTSSDLAVTVVGLAGIPIRWAVSFGIFGGLAT